MTKLNLLQKLAPTGIAALSVITATAGSMLFAPSAQAQSSNICFAGTVIQLGQLGSVQCVDKLFDNFSIITEDIAPDLTAEITRLPSGSFSFTVRQPGGLSGPFNAILNYDITITDPDFFFDQVGFDTDVDQIADNVTAFKDVTVLEVSPFVSNSVPLGPIDQLVSINGSTDLGSIFGATKISVADTINAGAGSTVFSITNTYTQDNIGVPEPSAMVGLVALGGLGLGLKRKKQS